MLQPDFIPTFITPLNSNSFPYFVTGSFATTFYGEPRLTHDIDLVVHLNHEDISRFVVLFPIEHYYCPPEDVIEIECRRTPFGHFNLIHHLSGLKADIYTRSADRLHQWGFEHRRKISLGDQTVLWVAPPEYIIIRKLEFYREGGSTKHVTDIRNMLPQIGDTLDWYFLKEEIQKRSLELSAQEIVELNL